jgi:hypothetical protein
VKCPVPPFSPNPGSDPEPDSTFMKDKRTYVYRGFGRLMRGCENQHLGDRRGPHTRPDTCLTTRGLFFTDTRNSQFHAKLPKCPVVGRIPCIPPYHARRRITKQYHVQCIHYIDQLKKAQNEPYKAEQRTVKYLYWPV